MEMAPKGSITVSKQENGTCQHPECIWTTPWLSKFMVRIFFFSVRGWYIEA
jgi:hypothetical protein